jgi:hypothetical protein
MSCGRRSGRCCLAIGPAREVAARVSLTGRCLAGLSICCVPVCLGGSCLPSSWVAGAPRPAGGGCGTGSRPACGRPCTIGCWTRWATRVRSTGRGHQSTARACGPGVGEADRRNPVDRGKPGSKDHLVIDAGGLPLAVGLSAANTHDSQLLEPMVDAVPAVIGPRGRPGRPRRRPAKLHADKGCSCVKRRVRADGDVGSLVGRRGAGGTHAGRVVA